MRSFCDRLFEPVTKYHRVDDSDEKERETKNRTTAASTIAAVRLVRHDVSLSLKSATTTTTTSARGFGAERFSCNARQLSVSSQGSWPVGLSILWEYYFLSPQRAWSLIVHDDCVISASQCL